MTLVMTLVVRDEEDVIEANLLAHRALGVDRFLVLDNGSTDRTPEILDRWRRAGRAEVLTEPDATTAEVFQEWLTRLARIAIGDLGADWVIHNDADEFWWPLEGTLRETLGAVAADRYAVIAPRLEFVPRPDGPEPPWERMTYRERTARVRAKVAHRAIDDIEVGPGSHRVSSKRLGLPPTSGRPSMRAFRERPPQPPLLAPAPEFPIQILHLPLRSFEQYRNRLVIGKRIAEGLGRAEWLGERLDEALASEQARRQWGELVRDDADVAAAVERGELVEDTRLRDLLRRVDEQGADPETLETIRPEPLAPEALERERYETGREAIVGLVHNDAYALFKHDNVHDSRERLRGELAGARRRANAIKRRAALKRRRLRRRARRAERRLERIEGSRWWRLRPRLPRRGGGEPDRAP